MSSRAYNLAVGTVRLAVAVWFFLMPSLLDYDAFIPVMLAIICLVSALVAFFRGMASG